MSRSTKTVCVIFVFLLTGSVNALAQASLCSMWPRFDQEIFSTVNKTADVDYGANLDYQGVNKVLKMDIYQPAGDAMLMRPLIIFAHGGSFLFGDKSSQDQADLCTHFAKRGYVCAAINYRLGIPFPYNAANAMDAVYRSVQDMKASIRFFRKDAATVNTYKVDPNIIFIGGSSAGAFTALQLAYMDKYAELPASIDTSVLGNLDGNSGNPGYPVNVKAVINLCGALGNAYWIAQGDPPLVSMHGTVDATVPYSHATLKLLNIYPLMIVDGSYAIHSYINTFNHPAEMYTWYGQGHTPYSGTSSVNIAYMDTTIRFVSNFLYKTLGCIPSDLLPLQNTFSIAGVNEWTTSREVKLERNPVDEYIKLENVDELECHFAIMKSTGQILFEADKAADNEIIIPVKYFSNGLYFLYYKTINKSRVLKVIVRHE